MAHTRAEWAVPDTGIVTFINSARIRHKRDPGRCYSRAGWQRVGFTAGGLVVFQQLERAMPAPAPVPEFQLTLPLGESQ